MYLFSQLTFNESVVYAWPWATVNRGHQPSRLCRGPKAALDKSLVPTSWMYAVAWDWFTTECGGNNVLSLWVQALRRPEELLFPPSWNIYFLEALSCQVRSPPTLLERPHGQERHQDHLNRERGPLVPVSQVTPISHHVAEGTWHP